MAQSLTVLPDETEYEKKEKCGLFGVWGTPLAAQISYLGIFAQQHRGQESAGIAVSTGKDLNGHAGMGLVSQVFTPRMLSEDLAGHAAIGHVRYSTTGSSKLCNAQPLLRQYRLGPVAVAHNGNLINAALLRELYEQHGHIFQSTTDTEIIVHLLAKPSHLEKSDPLPHVLNHLQGAFSLLFLFPDRIEAARDPWGIRPLSIGRLPGGEWCVASETCAFDAIGAEFVRDIEPGEIVTINDGGVASRRFAPAAPELARCSFEHVYFANPASNVFGINVQRVREELGRQLAREAPVEGDIVVPMPDSGRTAGLGFSKQSGIEFVEAIVPNRFVGRTFILPDQAARDRAVNLKLNIISDLVRDRRIIVVDDSIVRGTTTRSKMRALRRAGAKEIHLRISCPPIRHPCFYGVDFASTKELIAHDRTVEQIREFIEVDSLSYLSLEGMLAALGMNDSNSCNACWTGRYKVPIDEPVSKFTFEREQLKMF
ncbi:MAG TPA: amidophosphoribosyltransferase [Tepidisphaeraceae bacterium]|jgi:amidophosphoribosyltransferase